MMKDTRATWLVAIVAICAVITTSRTVLAQESNVQSAIALIKVLDRPGQIRLATIWDGNKYVQCRVMTDHAFRCEAAGTLMQPSLARVLTSDRVARLKASGWTLDSSFGNYVRSFASDTAPTVVAREVVAALSEGYDADIQNLEVQTSTVPDEPCPPRNGFTQNLAGMINDAASMARFAVNACAYSPPNDEPPRRLGPDSTAADLIALYGPTVTVEIERLRLNMHRRAYAIFDAGIGYVQCETQTEPDGFYCEAQSADSWPALATVLTSERIARLHAAGYADPGRGPNYSKTYLADKVTDEALTAEVLTLLHDVYGYYGATKLGIETEER